MGFFKDFKEDLNLNSKDDDEDYDVIAYGDEAFGLNESNGEKGPSSNLDEEPISSEDYEADKAPDAYEADGDDESSIEDEQDDYDDEEEVLDETAVISAGMRIDGDVTAKGSVEVFGQVMGNVTCRGKLTVSGEIYGKLTAGELFANKAHIEGDLDISGSIKVGQGTVIIGNLNSTSAVVAGAIKGNIDVKGPVIIDSTAVVVGDIFTKMVQVNSGATIDGRCTQCYSGVDTNSLFTKYSEREKVEEDNGQA